MDCDTGARALDESLSELLARLSGPVDIRFKVYGGLGPMYGLEHRGEDFVAILKCRDLITRQNRRPQQGAHFPLKLLILDAVKMLNLMLYLLLRRMKINDNDDESQRYGNARSNGPEKRRLGSARLHAHPNDRRVRL